MNKDNWNDKYQKCFESDKTCDQSYSYSDELIDNERQVDKTLYLSTKIFFLEQDT